MNTRSYLATLTIAVLSGCGGSTRSSPAESLATTDQTRQQQEGPVRQEEREAQSLKKFEALARHPRCRARGDHVACQALTQDDCQEIDALSDRKQPCDPTLPTRKHLAERRLAWETEACSRENAREQVLAERGSAESDDLLTKQLDSCIAERAADCQPLVDEGDFAGAAECWSAWPWNGIDLAPETIKQCLADAVSKRDALAACLAMPEGTDEGVVTKADCIKQKDLASANPRRCGVLTLDVFLAKARDGMAIDAESKRIELKAAPIRQRFEARGAACQSYKAIAMYKEMLAKQRRIENSSGVVDLAERRKIGEMLDILVHTVQPRQLKQFKLLWRRALNRSRDCK